MLHRLTRILKFWWQRRTRGWDDSDLWSLDYTLGKWILPRLKAFQDIKIGVPYIEGFNLHNDDNKEYARAEAEWQKIIEKMISAFELLVKDMDGEIISDEEQKEIEEGLDLFRKYLRNLWY